MALDSHVHLGLCVIVMFRYYLPFNKPNDSSITGLAAVLELDVLSCEPSATAAQQVSC